MSQDILEEIEEQEQVVIPPTNVNPVEIVSDFEEEVFATLDDIGVEMGLHFKAVNKNQQDTNERLNTLIKVLQESTPLANGYTQEDVNDLRVINDAYTKILQSLLTSPELNADLRVKLAMGLKSLDVWRDLEEAQVRMNVRDAEREKLND